MKNKKGFIISTTLYSIFGIMAITVFYILYILVSNRTTVTATTEEAKTCLENEVVTNDCSSCSEEDVYIVDKTISDYIVEKVEINNMSSSNTYIGYDNQLNAIGTVIYVASTNGLHFDDSGYYYRGRVEDNYAMIGDREYRILSFDSEYIKLISSYSSPLGAIGEITWVYEGVHEALESGPNYLTLEEAERAGAYGSIYVDDYKDDYKFYYNPFFLTTGDSTVIVDENDSNINLVLYNEPTQDNYTDSRFLCGVCYGCEYSDVRPVITLNINKIKFKGSGLEYNPYIIEYKDN